MTLYNPFADKQIDEIKESWWMQDSEFTLLTDEGAKWAYMEAFCEAHRDEYLEFGRELLRKEVGE